MPIKKKQIKRGRKPQSDKIDLFDLNTDLDIFDLGIDEIIPEGSFLYDYGKGYFEEPYAKDVDTPYSELDADLWGNDKEEQFYTDEQYADFVSECYKDLDFETATEDEIKLPRRWTKLNHHDKQQELIESLSRFITIAAGRRSGKTDIAKRKLVKRAIAFTAFDDGWFVAAAPTLNQAKRIFWKDLKALCPPELITKISESELTITLYNGAVIQVMGLEVPERLEGTTLDGFLGDEFASVKEVVWKSHIRPALSTINRPGWAILFSVPEGRNHFYHLCNQAKVKEGWEYYHWESEEILPASEIEEAKRDLDELTYDQEYRAKFVNFSGRAYYKFDVDKHGFIGLPYNPKAALIFCFDFNIEPGTATICQEVDNSDKRYGKHVADTFTAVIGEVHIPVNSNTPAVVAKLIEDWGTHEGKIYLYGDATGGGGGSAQTEGSDWDLIEKDMYSHFGSIRVFNECPRGNPRERARLNSMNTRFQTKSGVISMLIDNSRCPHTCLDFEGVTLLKGGSGQIDKKATPELTHLSDGLGYYINQEFPVGGHDTIFTGPLNI